MELEQIVKLVETVSASKLDKFEYSEEGLKLKFEKVKPKEVIAQIAPVMQANTGEQQALVGKQERKEIGDTEEREEEVAGNIVKSPLVGTFYTAPSEEAKVFVKEGDTVEKGQVIAIVEAMKLMNEIESDYQGTVTKILVENGEAVEYGQPLFAII